MCAKKKVSSAKIELTGVQDLYHFLYEACNILRKFVEHESFKDYITPLLYYKRLSDVWDEEYEAALAESGNDEEYARLPEQHRFVIPEDCHWNDVRARSENLGAAIVEALLMIEQANPDTLYGVLSVFPTDNFRDKNKLSDEVVRNLIEHLSSRKLGNKNYPADLMGDAYEILLKSFADESKAKAGEFYTPRSVVKLLVRILDPQPGERVYDPACGSGGMLIEAVHHMKNSKLCLGQIFGQEKNVKNAAIAKMNLFLHGASDFCIRQGDTLANPQIMQGGSIATFDCVIANPPFSLKAWNRTLWSNDPYGRNFLGTPPASRVDYAFIQHILKSMDENTGRCAILLPLGDLDRESETKIRENLVKSDLLEAVIGLGPNLFYNSPMEACIMICRSKKSDAAKGRVLFINAVKEVTRKNGESYLEPQHIKKIVDAYRNRLSDGILAYDATNDEIAKINYTLNISRYAHQSIVSTDECGSLDDAVARWSDTDAQAVSALDGIFNVVR